MKKSSKILVGILSTVVIFTAGIGAFYIYGLPAIVSNNSAIKFITSETHKILGADLIIVNPKLRTKLNSEVDFSVEKINLSKNNKELLNIEQLDSSFVMKNILFQNLIIKKLYANNVYINSADILALLPKQESKKDAKPSKFKVDVFNALIGVKYCLVTYNTPDIEINFAAKNIMLDRTKSEQGKKYLHFDFDFGVKKGDHQINVSANDQNRIYTKPNELFVDNFPININDSNLLIDIYANKDLGLDIDITSNNFNARDIYDIATSNIIIPNGKELFAPIGDVKGSVDIDLHFSKDNIDGKINVDETDFKVVYLENLPVKITKGVVLIGNKDITLKDFDGYYNFNKENSLNLEGYIKDYWKTCDTQVTSDIFVNNDFFEEYLSKLIGMPIGLVGKAGSKLTITSLNGSCDLLWYFILDKGEGFKFGDEVIALKDYVTMAKVDLSVIKNIFRINTIDYYIAGQLTKNMEPLVSVNGNFDMMQNMKLLDFKFNIPKPLPSEILNFITCQKIFKEGTVSGKLNIDNHGKYPQIDGALSMDKVRIPAQKVYIETAKFGGRGDKLGAIAKGKIKDSIFDFNGYILNEIKFPIIVKSINLTLDNIDIDKLLQTSVHQTAETPEEIIKANNEKFDDAENTSDVPAFSKGLIIIEKCGFNLIKGKYKNLEFGNIHANLTLDKDGVLKIWSNRFDIAEGISTLKVNADLIKKKFEIALGVKDVNSDSMATAILGLPREIDGRATGGIILNTDENLKLNGRIYFMIKDGSIEKVGYVEYLLKVASLFRNPLVMISPTTVGDLVTIPDGKFETISGDLTIKDNVIQKMMIKSAAERLSTFIAGKYNLENNDASLRIYTRMSNKGEGFAGFLRNISLNSLANRITNNSRRDSNYYASELEHLPKIKADDKDVQVFLTTVEGDVVNFNFLSSLKRIK